jgi:hypothetical protein
MTNPGKYQKQVQAQLQAESDEVANQMRAEQARILEAQRIAEAARQKEFDRQAAEQQKIETERVAQQQMLAMQRLATQAVTQSMQVLSGIGGNMAAPAAQVTRAARPRAKVRATSGSQGLRIGESATAAGAGLNIGV